jgi:hypothetical protein
LASSSLILSSEMMTCSMFDELTVMLLLFLIQAI